jgi:catechol 2,3-dioxygenase-like lactoylglutathione lyase family enzyme
MGAITSGVHHIGLTVKDLPRTKTFFIDTLGFKQIGEIADYPAVFLSDDSIMLTLWQVESPDQAAPFNYTNNIGLHHVAFKVDSDKALDELHQKLLQIDDVTFEFEPETLGNGPTRHMICFEPGGVRIEFIAPQG